MIFELILIQDEKHRIIFSLMMSLTEIMVYQNKSMKKLKWINKRPTESLHKINKVE